VKIKNILRGANPTLKERQSGVYNKKPGVGDDVFALIVRVTGENEEYGLGCIALGNEATACFVERQLTPLVLDESVFDTEKMWAKMFRTTVNVGRRGLALNAISGVDIAIWDLLGKTVGQPVHNFLGGVAQPSIRAYLSSGYAMEDLDQMVENARQHVSAGYTAFKMRFGYGPSDGRRGMLKNKEMIRRLRLGLGDDIEIMGDAYMGWTTRYATDMIRMIDEYQLTWVEEPLMPDEISGYSELRRSCRTAIAGGEHEATRWGFRQLIEQRAVDYLQLDVNRVGGITEAQKIVSLAASYDLPVVPHSPNFHNLPLIVSNLNTPLIEMFPDNYRDGDTFIAELFLGDPKATNGYVSPVERPGLGIELNLPLIAQYRIEPY
jgi:L-rhamnonate dehydratase